jgi:hypothetical protein
MLRCTHCDRENPDDAKFCGACGKPLTPLGATGCPLCGNPTPEHSSLASPLVRVRLYLEIECGGSRLLSFWQPTLDEWSTFLPHDGEPIDPAKYADFARCHVHTTPPFDEPRERFVRPVAWYAHISTVSFVPVHMLGFELNGFSAQENHLDVLRSDCLPDDEYQWESLGPDGLPDLEYTFNLQTLENLVSSAALCDEICADGPGLGYDPRFESFFETIIDDGRVSLTEMPYVVEQVIKGW